MSYFALTGLFNALVGLVSGLFVYLENPRHYRNKISGLYFLSFVVWSVFYCAWQASTTPQNGLFFARALMMGAIFIPVFQYHMTLLMYGLETAGRLRFLRWCYAFTFICAASNFTPYFIHHVEPRSIFPYWPVPGPLFHPYLMMFVGLVTLSLVLIWEYRTQASPVLRNRIVWFILGIAIGYGGGGTNFFLWYNIPLIPYLNVAASAFVGLTALSYFKLGLLDFRLFFRDTTIHFMTSMLMGGFCALAVHPLHHNAWVTLLILMFALLIPHLYQPLYRKLRHGIRHTKWGKIDDYLVLVDRSIGQVRDSSFTYDDLASNLVHAVLHTFPVQMAAVYFINNEKTEYHLRAQAGMENPRTKNLKLNRSSLSVGADDPLCTAMTYKQALVNREEIEAIPTRNEAETALLDSLARLEAELCAPFLFDGVVRGFLVVGRKKDGKVFYPEDLMAMGSYRRMGEDIMRYIMGMEHEIKHAALYSHDMNNDTKSLVQTLQFIRSPFGQKAKPERIHTMLSQAEEVAIRLNQSFQLNRDRSALILKSIRGEYERTPHDLVKLIRESANKFLLRAEEAHVRLQVKLPVEPVVVNVNSNDFVRVIDNLISNALRYVKADGHVSVEAHLKEGLFEVSVADNGEGIAPDVIERIWDFGWQVKDSKQGASGLGLSMVKQIIQLHAWSVKVESPGKSLGTRFTITVPYIKENSKAKEAA